MAMRLFWLAVVLLAAFLPLAPILVCAILIAADLVPDATSRLHRFGDELSDAQPVALLALSHFRAPPAQLV